MVQNGVEKCRAYGQYLGRRYSRFDNLLWMSGNDFQSWKDEKNDAAVLAVAEGIRERCGSTLGVGITGVAGPTGGTPDKPVGLVFHALAGDRETEVIERNFPGDRKRVRWFAAQQALDMIRRKVM